MLRRFLGILAAALPLTLAPLFGAQAAPQVLVLVATAQPVELNCANGQCSAEFTSLCLQEHRAQPAKGTPYAAFDTAAVQVIGERHDGSTVMLPATPDLAFAAERGHTAVKVSVPVSWLRDRDLAAVHVKMDDLVTLVPVAVADDPAPLTDGDIELAAGPLTRTAAFVLDGRAAEVDAARLTAAAINALPARGSRLTAADRAALWDTVVAPRIRHGRRRCRARRRDPGARDVRSVQYLDPSRPAAPARLPGLGPRHADRPGQHGVLGHGQDRQLEHFQFSRLRPAPPPGHP